MVNPNVTPPHSMLSYEINVRHFLSSVRCFLITVQMSYFFVYNCAVPYAVPPNIFYSLLIFSWAASHLLFHLLIEFLNLNDFVLIFKSNMILVLFSLHLYLSGSPGLSLSFLLIWYLLGCPVNHSRIFSVRSLIVCQLPNKWFNFLCRS